MEYQVLARKWRPRTFSEVVGQDHIVRTLKNSLNSKRIAHAYLFAGTRGVGKTTVARIFAKAVRCQNLLDGEPCLKCSPCLSIGSGSDIDYTEIDGASNNGVENIRELIENVHYLPSNGDYKVYIIDEVHMLSTGAFNALLKTLEEPPKHVIFIFATTDPQKLLATVISRCQRLDFKFVPNNELLLHVQNISNKEGIKFESEDLIMELCKHGRGSVRDTLSLLDQVLSMTLDKTITEDLFYSALGLANKEVLKELIGGIFLGQTDEVVTQYHQIVERNIELKSFINQMLNYLHFCLSEIENPEKLYQAKFLKEGSLDDIGYAEMFWIYEAIAKDADWVLKSIDPVNVLEVVLRKMSMRRALISAESRPEKKTEKKLVPVKPKTWEDFIHFAYTKVPATAANLERGNIIEELDLTSETIEVNLIFESTGGHVFIDYLSEPGAKKKVISLLGEYYQTKKNFKLSFSIIEEEEKIEKNFVSQADININKEKENLREREEEIIHNPRIAEAVKLFGINIDKVILNDEAKK